MRLQSSIHWIQGTFNFDYSKHINDIIDCASLILDDEFAQSHPITRGVKFNQSSRSILNSIIAYNLGDYSTRGYGWFSVPGSALEAISFKNLISLINLLNSLTNWKCTRIDFALDDYSKIITPELIYEAAVEGNYSGFRNKPSFDDREQVWRSPSYKINKSPYTDLIGNCTEALNIDFGSRNSNKSWHCYNKSAQSHGARDCTRMEIRLRDEHAHLAFQSLLQISDEQIFCNHIASVVIGGITFLDRSSDDPNLDRLPILPFWNQLIAEIGKITKYPSPKKELILENSVEWCARQWETTLAILYEVAGLEDTMNFCIEMINNGQARLEDKHRVLIKKALAEKFNLLQTYNLITNR